MTFVLIEDGDPLSYPLLLAWTLESERLAIKFKNKDLA